MLKKKIILRRKEHVMKFHAIIELNGKTATGIAVPAEVVAHLGSSKSPQVRITINGHTYRSTVALMGGVFMLPSARKTASSPMSAMETRWRSRSNQTHSLVK